MPRKFMIIEVDSEGKVINSWHGRDGELGDGEDVLLGASEGSLSRAGRDYTHLCMADDR